MNCITVKGFISNHLKVRHTKTGTPFCVFYIQSNEDSLECWIIGKQAYKFFYDVEQGTKLSVDCAANGKMQLKVLSYDIIEQPIRIGQVYDLNGNLLPHMDNPF